MLSVKLIEAVLVEQDLEGLIDPQYNNQDEYSSEAAEIYERLIRRQNKRGIIFEKNTEIINYISVVTFVFNESFGSGISYRGDEEPVFYFDEKYINKRLERIKIIAKLIFDLAKDEN
jgi:hypothetical protein